MHNFLNPSDGAILPAMPRKPFPESVQTEVLVRCRRRCALCFCLDQDLDEKEGQLAHIDAPEDATLGNAAWLCTKHHARYDSVSLQTKGYRPSELREYQQILFASVESFERRGSKKRSPAGKRNVGGKRPVVALEVYDRRLPIYQTTMQFVREVVSDLRPELKLIMRFFADTDQALFLYDDSIAGYLDELFKKALRLHTVDLMRTSMRTDDREPDNFMALVKEQTALASWFIDQHAEIRARFAPFLRMP